MAEGLCCQEHLAMKFVGGEEVRQPKFRRTLPSSERDVEPRVIEVAHVVERPDGASNGHEMSERCEKPAAAPVRDEVVWPGVEFGENPPRHSKRASVLEDDHPTTVPNCFPCERKRICKTGQQLQCQA
ncbi:MAG TPA: hypothetical protein DFS52_03230 [Myxococcales bacterium]|nr:hypothetical protein [Myxococcales bacterium]